PGDVCALTRWVRRLEVVLQPKLNLSHRDSKRSDDARASWSVINKIIRLCKVWMIEGVEEFRSEFDTLRFRQLEFFAKLPIKNILSRADQTVPCGVAEPESIFRQHGKGIN